MAFLINKLKEYNRSFWVFNVYVVVSGVVETALLWHTDMGSGVD